MRFIIFLAISLGALAGVIRKNASMLATVQQGRYIDDATAQANEAIPDVAVRKGGEMLLLYEHPG
jgi:hypothetical protein